MQFRVDFAPVEFTRLDRPLWEVPEITPPLPLTEETLAILFEERIPDVARREKLNYIPAGESSYKGTAPKPGIGWALGPLAILYRVVRDGRRERDEGIIRVPGTFRARDIPAWEIADRLASSLLTDESFGFPANVPGKGRVSDFYNRAHAVIVQAQSMIDAASHLDGAHLEASRAAILEVAGRISGYSVLLTQYLDNAVLAWMSTHRDYGAYPILHTGNPIRRPLVGQTVQAHNVGNFNRARTRIIETAEQVIDGGQRALKGLQDTIKAIAEKEKYIVQLEAADKGVEAYNARLELNLVQRQFYGTLDKDLPGKKSNWPWIVGGAVAIGALTILT